MAQGLPVFEWFLHILYLLVPPQWQWTVGTQRLHLSINFHRSKIEINIAIYKPEWYSQERKQHLLLEFIMNLKRFLSHYTPACQTKFKGFLFNVEIVFINCRHHSLTKLCSPNAAFYNFSCLKINILTGDYMYNVQRIIIRETRKKNCFETLNL